jgi:hypothetical protein
VYRFNHYVWEIDLTVYEKIVLLYLLERANEHGVCWPSLSTISRATGVSRRKLQRTLQSLKARGLVDWERIGGEEWQRNSYRLNLEAIARGGESGKAGVEDAPSEDRGLGGGVYQTPGGVYQTPGGVYQTRGGCLTDTLTNQITTHITTQKISSLSRSTVAGITKLTRERKRRGGQKLWPRKRSPKTLNPPLRARVSCLKKRTPPLVKRRTSPTLRTPWLPLAPPPPWSAAS